MFSRSAFFKSSNRPYLIALIAVAMILSALPLAWLRLFSGRLAHFSEVTLFSPPVIGLLFVLLLLVGHRECGGFFSQKRFLWFPGVPLAIILLICLAQYIVFDFCSFRNLCHALLWVMLPLTGAVFHREFRRVLPCSLSVLGIITLVQTFHDLRLGDFLFGISGNWNWNATLLTITSPFLGLALAKLLSRNTSFSVRWRRLLLLLFFVIIGLLVLRCNSKAVHLSIAFSILVFFGYRLYRCHTRLVLWMVPVLGILILIPVVLMQAQLVEFLTRDVRLPLWEGGLAVIGQHPLLGTGPALFESFYAPVIPAEYYLKYFAADRHTHPHNELIFVGAAFGLPALIAWVALIVGTIRRNLPYLNKSGLIGYRLLLFAFLVMLIHSLFDNLLNHWPSQYLFLLLLGVLSGKTGKRYPRPKREGALPHALRIVCLVIAGVGAIVATKMAADDFLASRHYRNALIARDRGDFVPAVEQLERSIAILPSPQNLYLAALIAGYELKQPQAAIDYLQKIKPATGFENYVHNHQLMARALAAMNRREEALPYFEQENRNYPLGIVNVYFHWQTLLRLDRVEEATMMRDKLYENLRLKQLGIDWLPLIIRRPDLEINAVTRQEYLETR